jgi:hypothetical protein
MMDGQLESCLQLSGRPFGQEQECTACNSESLGPVSMSEGEGLTLRMLSCRTVDGQWVISGELTEDEKGQEGLKTE